jgi:FkbM family methyltransferase
LPGRRFRLALERQVARPLLTRMSAKLVVPVAAGFRMRVDVREGFGRAIATSGIWEPHLTDVFRVFLSPGDACVDVGSHVGYYTLLAATLVGPTGHVYAIEPAPDTYAALVANVELNGMLNVSSVAVAAGGEPGEARLLERPEGQSLRSSVVPSARSSVEDHAPIARVPVRTVASLVSPADAARLRLVKIDVEGYELEVLRGVVPLLEAGSRPAILVEVHAGLVEGAVALVSSLAERYGLTMYMVEETGFDASRPWVGSSGELARTLERSYERHLLVAP